MGKPFDSQAAVAAAVTAVTAGGSRNQVEFHWPHPSNGPPNHQDLSITQNMCIGNLEV